MSRPRQPASTTSSDRRAIYGCLLGVIAVDSLAATALAIAGRPPVELAIGLLFGSAIGGGVIMLTLAPELAGWWWRSRRPAGSRVWGRPLRLMFLSRFDWPLFILTASWIGTAGTAIIWGIKPILTIVVLRQLVRGADGKRRYPPLVRIGWFWLALAAVGVALVVIGRPNQAGNASGWLALLGTLTGLAGVSCAGLSAVRLDWGLKLVRPLPQADQDRLALPVIAGGITLLGAAVGSLLLAAYRLGGAWPVWDNLWPGLLVGIVFTAGGWTLATAAWLKTPRLEIGGLLYLTPPVTVILLLVAGQLGQINPWLLALGGLLVLGSSLALVRADRRAAG